MRITDLIATMIVAGMIALIFAAPRAHAETSTFYGPDGHYQGQSITHGNSTSFYGPSGHLQGSSIRHDNTTTFYGSDGHLGGTVTTQPQSSFERNRR